MSTIQKMICDKCGHETDFDSDEAWYNLSVTKHGKNRCNDTSKQIYFCYDMCSACFSNLDKALQDLGYEKIPNKDNK